MCWSRAILPMPSRPILNAITSPLRRPCSEAADRLEEVRRRRELVSIAEIEQRGVLPVRSRSPARRAARRDPGRFPIDDADASGAQRHPYDVIHEALLAAERRRITAMQGVFTQQVRRLIARV